MSIAVICEHCQATFKVKDRFAGKRGKCPKCARPIEIPALDDDDDDEEVVMLSASVEKKPKPVVPKPVATEPSPTTPSPTISEKSDEPVPTPSEDADQPMPAGLVLDDGPPADVPSLEIDDDDIPVIKPVSASSANQNNRVAPTVPVGVRPDSTTPLTPVAAAPLTPAPVPPVPVPAAPLTPIPVAPVPAAAVPAAPLTPIPVAPLTAAPVPAAPLTPVAPVTATPVPAAAVPVAPVTAAPVAAIAVPAQPVPVQPAVVQPVQVANSPVPVLSAGGSGSAEEVPAYSQQLSDALLNSFQGEIEPVESSAGYGLSLVLVAIFMVLLPLAYVGMIIGIAYWMLKLGIFATIVGSILLLFLVKPIFVWPDRSPGIREVTPDQEPLLFSFIDRLCQVVGAPMPTQIEIDGDVNASASFRRGYLSMFMSNDLRLTIGMPFVAGLTLRQFTGVLAHEFGHFSQGWGMRMKRLIAGISLWFTRVVYQRDRLDGFVERLSQSLPIRIAIIIYLFRGVVWLTRRLLWLLMKLGFLVCGLLMREMEFDADRYEARVAGSMVFESTCRRLQVLGIAHELAGDDLYDWHMEGRLCDNLPRLITANIKHLPKEVLTAIDKTIQEGETGLFDTHPADRERIENAHEENAPGVFKSAYPATVLFRDFDTAARGVTWDYYLEVFGSKLKPSDLHPIDQLLAMQEKQIEANKAAKRYFQGIFWSSRPLRLPVAHAQPPADPAANIAQITQARDSLIGAKQNTKQLLEKHAEFHGHLVQANLMVVAYETGLRYDHSEFEFSCRNMREAQEALNRASYSMNSIRPQIEAFESLAGQRFIWALQLLFSDHCAGIENVAETRQRCTTLMGVLSAMLGHHYMIEKIEIDVNMCDFLFVNFDEDNRRCFQKFKEVLDTVYKSCMAMLQPLMNIEYPFDHALGRMSVSRFIIEQFPDEEDLSAIRDTAISIVEKLKIIYVRTVAELCQIAERVETEIGLAVILDEDMVEEERLE